MTDTDINRHIICACTEFPQNFSKPLAKPENICYNINNLYL